MAALATVAALLSGTAPAHAAAPVIDDLAASPGVVAPGGTAIVTVQAHDPDCPSTCTGGCGQTIRSDLTLWTATGGTIVATDDGTTGSPYTASATWQAPAAEGTYTLEVSLSDSGNFLCGGRETVTSSVDVLVSLDPNAAPSVTSVTASPGRVYTAQEARLACAAGDPDGDPVTFDWASDLGTVTPEASGAGSAEATLTSDRPGIATVTCTASDPGGASDAGTVQVAVSDAAAERALVRGLSTPHRLAIDDFGDVYAADRARSGIGVVNLFSGEPVYRLELPGVTAVAVDWAGDLLVGTVHGAEVVDRAGRSLLQLEVEPRVGAVADVAVDAVRQRYVTLHRTSGRVVVHDAAGRRLHAFGTVGDGAAELRSPGGVAVAPGGEVVVADSGHGMIKVFDALTGALIRSFGGLGGGVGRFVRLDDVDVAPDGVIWASDSFQDWVQSFDPDGTPREVVGTYGGGLGELKTAAGVAVSGALERLVAASVNSGSVQVFRTGGEPVPEPAPELSTTPDALVFGARPLGTTSAPRQVVLTNRGDAPLGVRDAQTIGEDFAVAAGCPDFLDPGESCAVSVSFSPTAVGDRAGSLLLDTSDPAAGGGLPVQIPLSGTGFVPGRIVVSPRGLDFPDQPVGTASAPFPVTLANPGSSPVAVDAVGVSGPFDQTHDCPRMLAGGASCTVSVRFAPAGIGDHLSGELTVRTGAVTERLALEGRGVALEVTPWPGA
ncbi:MAG: choice-of-anchor D domain-containing protein, partial [Acidobacteriota bacterium]